MQQEPGLYTQRLFVHDRKKIIVIRDVNKEFTHLTNVIPFPIHAGGFIDLR
jgi:hypothetical protein